MGQPKLVFFLVQPPYPPSSGLERRCLELLTGFRTLGYTTTLLSAVHPNQAHPGSAEAVKILEDRFVHEVRFHEYRLWSDRAYMRGLQTLQRLSRRPPSLNSSLYTPPGLRRWFREQVRRIQPDLVMIVFARWDGLLNGLPRRGERRIMETIDLSTLNRAMWSAIEQRLPSPGSSRFDSAILQEDFYERLNLTTQEQEFAVYDKYDVTIAISASEAKLIAEHTKRTRVVYLPMTLSPVYEENTYAGDALFPTGPNPFNAQAGLYFIHRVLPTLRQSSPDFKLLVTGSSSASLPKAEGIEPLGFVPDLAALYRQAPFLACPVIGGTGQLVKVVEAAAHGVASVVLAAARHRTVIRDGEDGLIAWDAEEFAAHCARLWSDRALCRRLGNAARERIAAEFSQTQLVDRLSQIVGSSA